MSSTRLPRTIDFHIPGVPVVDVVLVPLTVYREEADEDDGRPPEEVTAACWDQDEGKIWVRNDIPLAAKWRGFWHELVHVLNDYKLGGGW